ncbi:hypothetical protein BGZ75_008824 [Mortierella antarctica]|nr:hypothetical protein BGZ75_008824 [Mortierella antarctica]
MPSVASSSLSTFHHPFHKLQEQIPTMLYKSYITIMVLLVATVSSALPAALDLGDEILPQCINVGGVMCCRRYCYDPTVVETVANDQ